MSIHCKDGIYSVHYLDFEGNHRQHSCGKGENGKKIAYNLDKCIKAKQQARKEKIHEAEIMASNVVHPIDDNFETQPQRKTLTYHLRRVSSVSCEIVEESSNQSNITVTRRYLCVQAEEIEEAILNEN